MPPVTLLRAAALAAAASLPATAFIGGCNGNSASSTARAPLLGKSNEKAASEAESEAKIPFCDRSVMRVESYTAADSGQEGPPLQRLHDWQRAFFEEVRNFVGLYGHVWGPREVKALRAEAVAMRVLAEEADERVGGKAVEVAAALWPGAQGWPDANGWPGREDWPHTQHNSWYSSVCLPSPDAKVLWELRAFELYHCGLLRESLVEADNSVVPVPGNALELTVATTELWSRRKCRLDQLALRLDDRFGEFLPAASTQTCHTLEDKERADIERAKLILLENTQYGPLETAGGPIASLRQFVRDDSALSRIRATCLHLHQTEKGQRRRNMT